MIRFAPPLTITRELLDQAIGAWTRVLRRKEQELGLAATDARTVLQEDSLLA